MVRPELGQHYLQKSSPVDRFQKLELLAQGTCSQVFKAKELQTGETVALKKIRIENKMEGCPMTALHEIQALNKLCHENIIKLKETLDSPGAVYLVLEYMDHDLSGLARRAGKFTAAQIKCYMKQLLTGLHHCHVSHILHRDIKGVNILIDNNGTLKLADFGLARFVEEKRNGRLTDSVITLYYRPPELLLGSLDYGPAVDMWSVGCVFAELLDGKILFPGNNEVDQIYKIFELCGSPDESCCPGITKLPWYNKYKPKRPLKRRLREHFSHLDCHALELLEKMLILDPAKRISTTDALVSEYFRTDPCDPKSLPKYESSHEFCTRPKRQLQRQLVEAKRQVLQHPLKSTSLCLIQNFDGNQSQGQAGPNQLMHGSHLVRNQAGETGYDSVSHLQHEQGPVSNPKWYARH